LLEKAIAVNPDFAAFVLKNEKAGLPSLTGAELNATRYLVELIEMLGKTYEPPRELEVDPMVEMLKCHGHFGADREAYFMAPNMNAAHIWKINIHLINYLDMKYPGGE
jgi:hypothetical protein